MDYKYDYDFDEPEVIGCNYEFEVSTILSHRKKYSAFIEILGDKYFTCHEYDEAREYLENLLEKQTPKSQNLFDLFQLIQEVQNARIESYNKLWKILIDKDMKQKKICRRLRVSVLLLLQNSAKVITLQPMFCYVSVRHWTAR